MKSRLCTLKHLDLLLLLLWLVGSGVAVLRPPAPQVPVGIPDVEILSDDDALHRAGGLLYRNEAPFSGRLVERYDEGSTKSITPYSEGKAHGLAKGWYPGGALRVERLYQAGNKEGAHTGWWEDGSLKFVYHFKNDVHEGAARTWFADGSLYRDFNYENGKEAGLQRMWNEDGTIKANYVVKDGRRFGLIGSKPCGI